jgi:hypothetical protein
VEGPEPPEVIGDEDIEEMAVPVHPGIVIAPEPGCGLEEEPVVLVQKPGPGSVASDWVRAVEEGSQVGG